MRLRWQWLKWVALGAWLGANVLLWFLLPPRPRHVLPDDTMLTPDGRWAVTTTGGRITVRSVVDGAERRSVPYPAEPLGDPLAVSPDVHWLLTYDHVEVTLVDLTTGGVVARTPAPRQSYPRDGAAFAPDGRAAAWFVADEGRGGEFRVWDLTAGREHYALPASRDAVTFSPDGSTVATGFFQPDATDGVQIRDAATGEVRATIPGSASVSRLRRLAFSPDGHRLLQWEDTGTAPTPSEVVRVYDSPSGHLLFEAVMNGLGDIVWATDGELLLVKRLSLDQMSAEIADAATGAVRSQVTFGVPGKMLHGVSVSGDGRAVVTNVDVDPRGWTAWFVRKTLGPPDSTTVLWDARTGSRLAVVGSKPGSTSSAPDSRALVTLGRDNRWHVWDVPPTKPWPLFVGLVLFQLSLAAPIVLAWHLRRRKGQ